MKIGIVSDGKFGDRAFEIIREKFPTEWIPVPFVESLMADGIELDIPDCDLYISYVRHPDVALALIDRQRPVILGISFGPGFLRQAKTINGSIVAPLTMCSLDDNTPIPVINEFASVFGRPSFEVRIKDDGTVADIKVLRGSPCGSTAAATAELPGKSLDICHLQHYGLRICHFCRAPRFGKTCDKELSGLIHVRELLEAVGRASPTASERLRPFAIEMEKIYDQKFTGA